MSKQRIETSAQKSKRERDHQIVKGIFKNLAHPGQKVRFPFRRYKEDGVKWYEFFHDKEYEIPFMIYEHLNEGCYVELSQPLTSQQSSSGVVLLDHRGNPTNANIKKKHRFAFILTSFKNLRSYDEASIAK